MQVEFIEPFIRATFSVLAQVVDASPERGPLTLRDGNTFTSQELSTVLGVSGHIEGVALYGMSRVTALKIVSQMLGKNVKEIDEMASSALTELANIITGNAATHLEATGFQCEITPPSLICGSGVQVTTICPALLVPVSSQFGTIDINIALRNSREAA